MIGPPRRSLPADLVAWVRAHFGEHEAGVALEALSGAVDEAGALVGDRLARCAAVGSRGELRVLLELVELLKLDGRDVIVAGEYELVGGELRHLRDLTNPIDLPDTSSSGPITGA